MEAAVRDGVLQVQAAGTRWLSTGWNGGYRDADAAYNISVPTGWDRTDLTRYVQERLEGAGFEQQGPALLTGVDMRHAAGAVLDPVWAVATVGLSNPASLPLDPVDGGPGVGGPGPGGPAGQPPDRPSNNGDPTDAGPDVGTVNVILGTDRALDDASLATLLGVVVEAKTATLQQLTGFTGTTSDAAIVGTDPAGESSQFAGSATAVGGAARAAVREAVLAAADNRYAGSDAIPESVAEADSGVETTQRARVFRP
jgi:adenosylcobinamide hydrolase